jgi:hypothetical protein
MRMAGSSGWTAAPTPGIGERGPVYIQAFQLAQFPALPNNRRTPIHHGAENVKRECLYAIHTVILASEG